MVKPTLKLSCLRWYRKYKTSIWGMILTIYSWQRWEWFIVRSAHPNPSSETGWWPGIPRGGKRIGSAHFLPKFVHLTERSRATVRSVLRYGKNWNVTLDRIRMKTPVLDLLNFVNVPTGVSTTYPVDIPDLLDACFLAVISSFLRVVFIPNKWASFWVYLGKWS